MKPIGNGTLFISDVKRLQKDFTDTTRSRYDLLCKRMKKKGYDAMPFTVEQYRKHCLAALGGRFDAAIRCRYCRRILALADTVGDHAIPLSRGGSPDLSNIELTCAEDNDRKGGMRPEEYEALLEFVDREMPLARTDIMARLQKATKLAAGLRHNMARIAELKRNGAWAKAGKRKSKSALAKSAAPEDF